ncbi:hypothetical protein HC251_14905 [Iamia sp. SCSIO 61187]|uniref:hypothetical protein n=1 Tax=Iamia sp. SCSIO 61187 TaxID=2722752 RepID=UPI001C62B30A|nr:hypothetical protein [Iamia sp. SCSIO 61187]QYG93587.1 hypothetical protein HC251_14905 [Iamia sp. SCSIO 61187]
MDDQDWLAHLLYLLRRAEAGESPDDIVQSVAFRHQCPLCAGAVGRGQLRTATG